MVTIALAQINTTVGDISGNIQKILDVSNACRAADIVVFPEMTLTGYPLEDLALSNSLLKRNESVLPHLAEDLEVIASSTQQVLVGHLGRGEVRATNSVSILQSGHIADTYAKHHLPNYGVFDEKRIFEPGKDVLIHTAGNFTYGVVICEDLWRDGGVTRKYKDSGIDALFVLNGSPYEMGKRSIRTSLASKRAKELGVPVLYVNLVGGQDDIVFDGGSFAVDKEGNLLSQAAVFEEDTLWFSFEDEVLSPLATHYNEDEKEYYPVGDNSGKKSDTSTSVPDVNSSSDEEVYSALVLSLRDYVGKNNFAPRGVVLGMSGGIDSALCAAIAADAIGGDKIIGVSMPSHFSSDHSRDDAADQMRRNGGDYRVQPIGDLMNTFTAGLPLEGIALENLQARLRGMILMAISNAEGPLVLATGNKSELTVGYSTIYGDACGGFAPLKDVAKTRAWSLAQWRNKKARELGEVEPIPVNSITKPPSAELAPGQVDTDSLPAYELLDAIAHAHVEKLMGRDELLAKYLDKEAVERVLALVDRSEWKRRQYPIGTKITALSYGRDRRVPITTKWKG